MLQWQARTGVNYGVNLVRELFERATVRVGGDEKRGGKERVRRFASSRILDEEMICFNESLENVAAAVLLRQMFYKEVGVPVLQPAPGLRARMEPAVSALVKELRVVPRYSSEQFLSTYHGPKLARYRHAIESLRSRPLERKDAKVSAFLKYQKEEGDAVPRVISPRSYRFLAASGRFLKAYEAPLYRGLRKMFGGTVVAKGLNSVDQAKLLYKYWNQFRRPVAVGLDVSRFDQHVSKAMLQIMDHIWLSMTPKEDKQTVSRILTWRHHNLISWRVAYTEISYVLLGQRMSGEMDTGSGNCGIMCMMVYAYMLSKGLRPGQYRLINNGDDAIIMLEHSDLDQIDGIVGFYLECGMHLKIEKPVVALERVEFCQCRPVFDGLRWRMVRLVPKSFLKDAVCTLVCNSMRDIQAWMTAVGQAGIALTGGLPVLQEFYAMYTRLGMGIRNRAVEHPSGLTWMSRGCTASYSMVSPQARVSFWEAFGVLPSSQVSLESIFKSVNRSVLVGMKRCSPLTPWVTSDYQSL